MQVPINEKLKQCVIAASIAAMFGGVSMSVHAESNMENLIEKLHDRGVLTDDEFEEMSEQARVDREAEEAAADESVSALGSYADGFSWSSGDGGSRIAVAGRIQFDYRAFDNNGTPNTFDIRRAYLGVKGQLYKNWTYELTGDFANDTLEYAFLDYKWSNLARARGGAFKFPFSFEELTSSRFIDFTERSLINRWVPGKDQGALLYGGSKKGWSYGISVANGEGKNRDEQNAGIDDKDVIGRVSYNFAPLLNWQDGVFHAGLGYTVGVRDNTSPGRATTEGRGATFFRATAAPMGAELDRTRQLFEGMLAFGPVKLQGEVLNANFQGEGGYDRDIDIYYVSASWMITGERYVKNYTSGGMRRIKPNQPVQGGGWGAWELGVRFSNFDAPQYANTATSTNNADGLTIGLKWIPDPLVRILVDYVDTSYSTPILADGTPVNGEKAFNFRAQLDF